jgi:TDG/mug DNA glycosylase family protein
MLPDYLQPGLDLIIVGFNPSLRSAKLGHYYAGKGNQFWPFMYEAGFTDRLFKPEEDSEILSHNIGLTDIVKRATRGIGNLKKEDYQEGFPELQKKLATFKPRIVCFNGKSGYNKHVRENRDYGLQTEKLEGADLFLTPSTSGALPLPRKEKLSYFQVLKDLLEGG